MMAPYAIGHIKISFLLEELGYKMQESDRFNLFLTNTLDMEDLEQIEIPGLGSLSEESHKAGQVKKNEPILVILGNPPYSGISSNINEWTEKLLKTNLDGALSYYEIDGKKLQEKKLWLQDDYVKFIRFSQWKIHKAGQGVVGMITNHSYLDNPTFRGMRKSLMNTFNEIYIIDLHGNGLKKETTPEGGKDENVFDIRQGTAIAIMVKIKGAKGCKIVHRDIYGLREEKYEWLGKKNFKRKDYEVLQPESPWYFFVRRDTKAIEHFNNWIKINDLFPINNVGIVTARDHFAIDDNLKTLEARIRQFRDLKFDDQFIKEAYRLKDTSTFKLSKFRHSLSLEKEWNEMFDEINYRPFDKKHIFYSKWVVERPISDLMQHMRKENLGLAVGRQGQVVGDEHSWNLALVTENLIDFNLFYRGGEVLFPLYLYKPSETSRKTQTMMLFEPETKYDSKGRIPNISKDYVAKLEKAYKKKFQSAELTPEHVLHYCYAILYSNTYREKFAEFLRIDFPRIPFTSQYKLFNTLATLGEELSDLHLLKHKSLNKPIAKYKGKGDNRVEKIRYNEGKNVVFINEHNYFEGITSQLWSYNIGGYQILEKYLKGRKGRIIEDPVHYCKIVMALSETISLQEKIDKYFNAVEESSL
jgi:predicted helicase